MQRSLDYFVREIVPQHEPSKHLKPVLDVWQRAKTQQVFAVIELPPRHAKTETCMSALAWHLFNDPAKTSVYATYAQQLARSKSRIIRQRCLESGITLDEDLRNLDEFRTTQGGGLLVTGVGGPLTGQGVNGIAVVDDSVKNREEANSIVKRDSVWDWFRDVLWTRLEDNASVIVQHTRWHEDDLIGRILSQYSHFERIRLPAIAESSDILGRVVGEALWPERFSIDSLKQIQQVLGSYSFAALYQQAPSPIQGSIFQKNWFQYVDQPPDKLDNIILSVDCAGKKTTDGSETAMLVVGSKGPYRYIIDSVAEHYSTKDTINKILELRNQYKIRKILVEDKAAGTSVIEALQEKISGVIPIQIPPHDNKESRALAIQPEVESKHVAVIKGAPWVEKFIHQNCTFPTGTHDDIVDAFTQALNYMRSRDAVVARARALSRRLRFV